MKKKFFKRLIATVLVTTLTVNTCIAAYAKEQQSSIIVTTKQEQQGFEPVIQCKNFDIQCGSKDINGEVEKTEDIATLHDGIMSMLGEGTVINTTDYLGNSEISNATDTYSVNMYNANAGIVNLSEVIVAESNIGFGASEVNGDSAILYSKNGDINFYCGSVNFTGIIYAPNGTVHFEGSNIDINGVIIANEVIVRAGTFNITYNESIAKIVDNLDYIECDELFSIGACIKEDGGCIQTAYLQWEEDKNISSVEVYARYGIGGFKKVAEVTDTEYTVSVDDIKDFADFRVFVKTIFGEEISSNIVTLVRDESGVYEDTVDTDKDGIPDGYEYLIGTDALIFDTDGDGFDDGYEANILYTNPIVYDDDTDFDGDGLTNFKEYSIGTNPYLIDSDFDGLTDNEDGEPMKTNVDTGKEINYDILLNNKGIFEFTSKYFDEDGNKCEVIYNSINGQVNCMINSSDRSYNIYNQNNQLTAAIEQIDENIIINTYSYVDDYVETITHNGFQYKFAYDENGNIISVNIGERRLITNFYSNNKLKLKKYGNGDVIEYCSDEEGNIKEQKINGETVFTWTYDEEGNVKSYVDKFNDEQFIYTYDEVGNIKSIEGDNGFCISYLEVNDTYSVVYKYNGKVKTQETIRTEQTKSNDYAQIVTTTSLTSGGKLISVVADDETTEKMLYDNEGILLNVKYNYSEDGITKIDYQNGKVLEYVYDKAGNIISVIENGEQKISYEYDGWGQLIRENNAYADTTYTYTYDKAGNLLESATFAFSIGELDCCLSSKKYEYTDKVWKDLLTTFNGQKIVYDEIGNPILYRDNIVFEWTGRQLTSVQNGDDVVIYTYDSNGIRKSKTINNITTFYQNDGTKIVSETTNGNTIWYIYDESDSVIGLEYNGKAYYFEFNALGDVIRIFDEDGKYISEYVYDAWGNVIEVKGNEEIAKINPFRYRGYYQDNETGFYYLESRYYDCYTGRFLNADTVLDVSGKAIENNLFAYCYNNPIMNLDPTGRIVIPRWIVSFVVDAIVTAIGLGWLFAPVKKLASTWGKDLLRSNIKTPLVKLLRGIGEKITVVIKFIKNGIKKIPFIGGWLSKKINVSKLTDMLIGGGASATANKILNVALDNIDVLSSLGGIVSGILDIWSDGKFNKKISIG